jgi:hypothetical protein
MQQRMSAEALSRDRETEGAQMSDDEEKETTVQVELLFNLPPRDALQAEISDTLQRYPNGLAECIINIDNRELYFIIGPCERGIMRVDVWERYEAEAMYKNANLPFFKGGGGR